MDEIANQLAARVTEQLPGILHRLLETGFNPENDSLQLECSLTTGQSGRYTADQRVPIASVQIGQDITPLSSAHTPEFTGQGFAHEFDASLSPAREDESWGLRALAMPPSARNSSAHDEPRPPKRLRIAGALAGDRPLHNLKENVEPPNTARQPQSNNKALSQQRKRALDSNIALQPSPVDKFISGVWESIYSDVRMDPTEVIEQWQAIESSGQPKLLSYAEEGVAVSIDKDVFARVNSLARKICQTSRACRSLEVIVQAYWIQCFDNRVAEIAKSTPSDKARKAAIGEACVDFNWTEKELRNKMAVWRGYNDIKIAAGWAALVFAGMGLYRFCKYRVSFTEEAFQNLRSLNHRFEVAADTIHPRWRTLLGIIGIHTERKYIGHPHDWVINGPDLEPLPLSQTYHQWDPHFSYTHLQQSEIDEEAWGEFDPRTIEPSLPDAHKCQVCGEEQSNDPPNNNCVCFSNLYGSVKAGTVPVQIFRTPSGKNNGLMACCAFEKGAAVGEFVGQITSGIEGLDVMVGQTDRTTYQIWQGKAGNHTRFVNHSCQPNSQFERFIWLGTQRFVLVSKGIEAGHEITVDYGDTYWRNLDKKCQCEAASCRYRDRRGQQQQQQIPTPPDDESLRRGKTR